MNPPTPSPLVWPWARSVLSGGAWRALSEGWDTPAISRSLGLMGFRVRSLTVSELQPSCRRGSGRAPPRRAIAITRLPCMVYDAKTGPDSVS